MVSHCAHRTRPFQFFILLFKGMAGLSFTARIERALFHRARSASKKDGPAIPRPSLTPLHPLHIMPLDSKF
jgi:hypothetical protein